MFSFAARGLVEEPNGEKAMEARKLKYDKRLRLELQGARINSDAGLLACRELDGAQGLTKAAPTYLRETRGGSAQRAVCCHSGAGNPATDGSWLRVHWERRGGE